MWSNSLRTKVWRVEKKNSNSTIPVQTSRKFSYRSFCLYRDNQIHNRIVLKQALLRNWCDATKCTNISVSFPDKTTTTKFPCDAIPECFDWRIESSSYLAGRDELQRTKGGLQVLSVALEVEESAGNRVLELGGALPGGRVGGNLVDGSHVCERRECCEGAGLRSAERRWTSRSQELGICCGIGGFA